MITVETWQQVRHLAALGKSQRVIAEELGLSRNTVAEALKREAPPRYTRSPTRGAQAELQGFREQALAGLRRGLSGVRLLEELRAVGYARSEATFYRWLAALQAEVRAPDAACRFETDPGEQAQFDWSPYTVRLGEQATRIYLYSLLLGYSRRVHWFPSFSEKQGAVFEGLEAGFRHFGGACRFLLVDNAKVFVTAHPRDEVVWNPNFLRFCGHYAVQPIAGTPRHPQGKGKVENPFRAVESRFLTGGEWRDLDHLQQELAAFEARWEQRVHGTTKVPPLERFAAEREYLLPLPGTPFLHLVETFRHVSRDCLVSYEAVRYSVPWSYAGKQVMLRVSQGRELVFYATSGREIARHRLYPRGTPPVINPQHYEGLRRRHYATLATLLPRFRERYGAAGRTAECFVQRLMDAHRHHPDRAIAKALELLSAVPDEVALQTLAEAVEVNLCTLSFLEELLRRRLPAAAGPGIPHLPAALPNGQLVFPHLDIERPLAAYGSALDAPDRPGRADSARARKEIP